MRHEALLVSHAAFRCDIRTTHATIRHIHIHRPSALQTFFSDHDPSLNNHQTELTAKMAYYNLDLDQFLPLASETIGYDFSSLVSPNVVGRYYTCANHQLFSQSSSELDLDFLANESINWDPSSQDSSQNSSPQLSPTSTSQPLPEDRRRSRFPSSSSNSSPARTAAQQRRKEQNRAAQQAYRKRKEDLIRSLEAKIERLESTTFSLQVDNARLQSALQCLRAENDYLHSASTSASSSPDMSPSSPSRSS